MIMCGLLRYIRTLNPNCPNFLDKKDSEFLSLHGAMDVVFHQLHFAGVGRMLNTQELSAKRTSRSSGRVE